MSNIIKLLQYADDTLGIVQDEISLNMTETEKSNRQALKY